MGIMKWMMKRGDLGGIARSTANAYREIKDNSDLPKLDRLLALCALRYGNPASTRLFPDGAIATLAYIKHRLARGEEIGLLTVCFGFAAHEMDVAGIENDVAVVLAEVLRESGLSDKKIFGRSYSIEDFETAISSLGK